MDRPCGDCESLSALLDKRDAEIKRLRAKLARRCVAAARGPR